MCSLNGLCRISAVIINLVSSLSHKEHKSNTMQPLFSNLVAQYICLSYRIFGELHLIPLTPSSDLVWIKLKISKFPFFTRTLGSCSETSWIRQHIPTDQDTPRATYRPDGFTATFEPLKAQFYGSALLGEYTIRSSRGISNLKCISFLAVLPCQYLLCKKTNMAKRLVFVRDKTRAIKTTRKTRIYFFNQCK